MKWKIEKKNFVLLTLGLNCLRYSNPTILSKIPSLFRPWHLKDFELIEEDFLNIAHNDERFKKVRIIMCNVPCSKSAVVNPVDFVLQEGNMAAKLLTGKIDANKQKSIISYEHMILRQAMKFTQVQSVLYFTSSDKPAENEDLVMRSLKEYREEVSSKSPFQISPFLPDLVSSLKRQIESNDNGMQTACMESSKSCILFLFLYLPSSPISLETSPKIRIFLIKWKKYQHPASCIILVKVSLPGHQGTQLKLSNRNNIEMGTKGRSLVNKLWSKDVSQQFWRGWLVP